MGRPGAGSGGSRSSGGHGAGRSSGGHRMGGGNRPRGGSGSSGGFGFGGFGRGNYSPGYSGYGGGSRGGGEFLGGLLGGLIGSSLSNSGQRNRSPYANGPIINVTPPAGGPTPPVQPFPQQQPPRQPNQPRKQSHAAAIFGVIVVVILLVIFWAAMTPSSSGAGANGIPASTVNREKIDTGLAFNNDCVQDQLGWISNVSQTERQLQTFYNKTGVQPYVVLKSYDPSLKTDSQKEQYSQQWYEDHIHNEGTFLFMYFAEQNAESDVGYMTYVAGKQTTSVMDSQAVDIFWAYMDQYWYSNMSTGGVIVKTFDSTADRIMERTTTTQDVLKYVAIAVGIIAVGIVIVVLIRQKYKRDKQKAEETERILNTPLPVDDSLLNKYEGGANNRHSSTGPTDAPGNNNPTI
ncbi:hypothetical protein [Bifidobacterium magnum]|uniref:PE-PGRS family protein n=1 Tax=Bifidobacterium magnum TaxID=1692 RepID=A0A087BE26_9BIFI|nr:hypothetical protein [Bifidobacterium magnum]KFI69276.1 PE-PGRS family protein [Bifidobacterium magnum]